MMDIPSVNALLNAICTMLLIAGYVSIRRKAVPTHRKFMIAAYVTSVLFMVGYITHKISLYIETGSYNTVYSGPDSWRTFYLVVLVSHILLAATIPFLATVTLYLGTRMRITTHRRIARITLPIWLYVSVTGVLVYMMLYVWFPKETL